MSHHKTHHYRTHVTWDGNTGHGTQAYQAYERSHTVRIDGKPPIAGSSDPMFNGDPTRHNPEELLVAALSSCHMLWYLHLCSQAGVVVSAYTDDASGTLLVTQAGGGHFSEVRLRPAVTISTASDPRLAQTLHEAAHQMCFIANSVNFPVFCEPSISVNQAA
jgi:organic hydroperoxide reductase OsmC/OhrA